MSSENSPREADVDQTNQQLEEGLRHCREIVASYRAKLEGGEGAFYPEQLASGDIQQQP